MILRAFRVPLGWSASIERTGVEVVADNCFGLAAQLAYSFFLALFPALLFLVAIVSCIPISGMLDAINGMLAQLAPGEVLSEVLSIVQEQILKIAHEKNGGLLTVGMLGTIWSTSSGVDAIISTLTQAYDSRGPAIGGVIRGGVVLGGVVRGEAALMTDARLRSRLAKRRT